MLNNKNELILCKSEQVTRCCAQCVPVLQPLKSKQENYSKEIPILSFPNDISRSVSRKLLQLQAQGVKKKKKAAVSSSEPDIN